MCDGDISKNEIPNEQSYLTLSIMQSLKIKYYCLALMAASGYTVVDENAPNVCQSGIIMGMPTHPPNVLELVV